MQNVPGPQPLQSNNFFHKITIVNICLQIWDILLVSSAKQREIRLHVCHESMAVLSQFCPSIIIFFYFWRQRIKMRKHWPSFFKFNPSPL